MGAYPPWAVRACRVLQHAARPLKLMIIIYLTHMTREGEYPQFVCGWRALKSVRPQPGSPATINKNKAGDLQWHELAFQVTFRIKLSCFLAVAAACALVSAATLM